MLNDRLRRRPNINPALGQHLVPAGYDGQVICDPGDRGDVPDATPPPPLHFRPHGTHEMLTQCCVNGGPASTTLGHH